MPVPSFPSAALVVASESPSESEPPEPGPSSRPDLYDRDPSGLLRRLKLDTQPEHVAIEQSVRFLDAGAPLSLYRDYLGQLLGFYEPIEVLLADLCRGAELLSVEQRKKAHLIAHDLRALGLDAAQIAGLPRCQAQELPQIAGLQQALGCLYVLEGATLGGRYVHHRLSLLFPGVIGRSSSFLRCYGSETRARWLEFGHALTRYAEDPDQIVHSARATFRALHRWLQTG